MRLLSYVRSGPLYNSWRRARRAREGGIIACPGAAGNSASVSEYFAGTQRVCLLAGTSARGDALRSAERGAALCASLRINHYTSKKTMFSGRTLIKKSTFMYHSRNVNVFLNAQNLGKMFVSSLAIYSVYIFFVLEGMVK